MPNLKRFDPNIASKKATTEGTIAAASAIIITVALRGIRMKNPNIPWSPSSDPAVAAASLGLVVASVRWIRNWWKHR